MNQSVRANIPSTAPGSELDLAAQFRHIAELRGDVAWIIDCASFQPTYISPNLPDVLGFEASDVAAQLANPQSPGPLSALCAGLPARLQRLRDGDLSRLRVLRRFEQRHLDGHSVPVEVISSVLTDAAGAPAKVVGVLRDISAERGAARRFASMLNHEFRTPLSTIDGAIQRLEATQSHADEPTRQRYRKIQTAVDRLIELLDQHLSPDRMEEIQAKRPDESVAPAKLLEEMAEQLRAGGREVTLRIEGLPSAMRCQPQGLRVALKVLVANALAHSTGPLLVRGHTAEAGIALSLADRGPGIAPGELAAIFGKGVRGSNARAPGSGLGLYLARSIVEVHGGHIAAANREQGGAVFTIWLPVVKSLASKVINSDNSANK